MRRFALIGLAIVLSVLLAPTARASDDSVRQVVQTEAARQVKEDAKFRKAVKTLKTKAQFVKARTATIRQIKSVDRFHDALAAEQADSERVKTGRSQILKGMTRYNRGLEKFRSALTKGINSNGRDGESQARAALKTVRKALKQIESGAKKLAG